MRQFEGLEDPPLFADAVVTVAVSEGVYLVSFAAPPCMEEAEMDEFGEIEVTGGPIVAQNSVNAGGQAPGFATQFCDVEVDPETGRVQILRFVAAQDVGKAIHPSYVEGQIQGGVVQGIGWALNEEYIYNAKGQLDNAGFLDYRCPVASDLPMIDTILVEVPNPAHPFGAKGVGEVNICPPMAAIANAIHRAIGVRMYELPMSPPKILAALDAQKKA